MTGNTWPSCHLRSLRGPVAARARTGTSFLGGESRSPELGASPKRIERSRGGRVVMTLDARASRRTRDPETDPPPFFSLLFESASEWNGPRSDLDVPLPLRLPLVAYPRVLLARFPPFSTAASSPTARTPVVDTETYTHTQRHARNEIRETMVPASTVLDLRTLRSLRGQPALGHRANRAPVDPSTRKRFPSSSRSPGRYRG